MSIKPGILIASAASLLALYACNSSDFSPGKGAVAATVNGTAINQSRVDLMVKQQVAQGQPDSPELRKNIIDHLTMQLLLSQEAIKNGLHKTPEVMDQVELTQESILANAFVQDYVKKPVSDDMLQAEYDKLKAKMTGVGGSEFKARHILVDKEAEAKEIIAKLKSNPKAFDALAMEKSKDPGSKGKGGDLGWFDPRGMVPEFAAALAKLAKGKFTEEPVKSQFGYHVILLEDSRAKQVPPLDQIKPMLQQQAQQQNLRKLLDDTKAKAKIEIAQAATPAAAASKEGKPSDAGK